MIRHSKSSLACGVCGESNNAKYKCPKCRLPYCSVKCCKDHKVTCIPRIQRNVDIDNQTSGESHRNSVVASFNGTRTVSKYLAAEELTQDPLLNSVKRKKMLRENEDDPEDEGWRITQEMMDRIDKSEWLRKELADGGLRQIIAQIDNADDDYYEETTSRKRNGQQGKRKKLLGGVKDYEHEPSPRELELMKAKRLNPNFANFIDRLMLIAGVLVESDKKTVEQEVVTYLNAHGHGDEPPSNMGVLSLAPIVKMKGCRTETKLPDILKEDESFSGSTHEDDESSSLSSSSSSYSH